MERVKTVLMAMATTLISCPPGTGGNGEDYSTVIVTGVTSQASSIKARGHRARHRARASFKEVAPRLRHERINLPRQWVVSD
jgi:hypothetical protein